MFVLGALGCGPPARVTGRVEIAGADSAAGAVVRLGSTSVVTDASGRFELDASADSSALVVTAEAVTPRSRTVPAAAGDELVVRFTAVGTLTGTARRGGAATGNATVAVSAVGGARTFATDTGAWTLEVPAGTWVVRADSPGFEGALSAPVTVGRGEGVTVPPLILPLVGFGFSGSLAGNVLRVGSANHDGVRVLVEGAGRTALTADGGTFEIPGVPEGSYTLVFEYDGLVERVPNVFVTRGADGFIVDQKLFRLGDRPISLMGASRLESSRATLAPVEPPFVAWLSTDATQTATWVRWANATKGTVNTAGRVAASYSWNQLVAPRLSPGGGHLVWSSNDGNLQATSTADANTRVIATGFRRGLSWSNSSSFAPISPGGLVAFEGLVPETNFGGLLVASVNGGPVQVVRAWQDSADHVYGARFQGEALVSMSDVYQYTGALRWWKAGGPEQTLASGASVYSFSSAAAGSRYVASSDTWHTSTRVFDLETGAQILSHPGDTGLFSEDFTSYAFVEQGTTKVLDLAAKSTSIALSTALPYRACVVGNTVVGQGDRGEVVAASNGKRLVLAPAPAAGRSRQLGRCRGGRVYWGEWATNDYNHNSLFEAPLAGGPVVELAAGKGNTSYYAVEVHQGRVWFFTNSYSLSSVGYGTLWMAPQGGTAVMVADDVRMFWPKSLVPSPDGSRIALLALDGLYLVNADGTGKRRLATGVDAVAWVGNHQLVFTVPPPAPPFTFQGGVYLAQVD